MTTAQVCICFYFSDERRTSSSNQKVFLCIQQSPVSQVIPYKRVAVADGKTGMPMYQPGVNPLMFQQHMAMPFQQGGFFPGTVACKFLFQVIFKRDISYQASFIFNVRGFQLLDENVDIRIFHILHEMIYGPYQIRNRLLINQIQWLRTPVFSLPKDFQT